jgi:hypothetical protein
VRTTFSQIAFRPLCPRCGHERRTGGRCIGAAGYDRTRDTTRSLENLNFKLKLVAALHI